MKDRTEIGQRIKDLRKKSKYSQSYVAEKLYISQSAYSLIENSQNGIVTEHIIKLSRLYEVTTDFILKGDKMLIRINYSNGFMPLVKREAHAGFLKNFHEENSYDEYEWYRIPGYNPSLEQKLFEVEGESMAPTILPGDIVICQPQNNIDNILDGSLILFITNNSIFIKRVRIANEKEYLLLEGDNAEILPAEERIPKKNILQAMAIRGKISSVLVPHHQIASAGKIDNLEESLELLKKELYTIQKKLEHFTK